MTFADPGTLAPDFTTQNHHGQSITLSALRGSPVVLVFYPFAFTGICTGELRALQKDIGQFRALNAHLFGISTDPMFSLRTYAEQLGLSFDLLTDHWPHGAIAESYGVFDAQRGCALRGSFVLDAGGVITWRIVNRIGEARDLAEHLAALRRGRAQPE